MIRSVAIVLGDNDFGNTFRNLLETVTNILIWSEDDMTPDVLEKLIRMGITYHYIAFQNQFKYRCTAADIEHIDQYLSKAKILFDAEADAAYNTEDHDGGAWHLTVQTGQVNSF